VAHDESGAMAGLDARVSTAENYRRFARREVVQASPQYARLAEAVAADERVVAFLESLPQEKRQPNLLFAAAAYLLGEPADAHTLNRLVASRRDELGRVMRTRRTQTNEAARCATLLPALAMVPGPLALLEVGASAGLTLLPDRYSYDYAGHRVEGTDRQAPVLYCQPYGPVPVPGETPGVVWRAGLDLNPLDVNDADDARWLECLLWPGETGRWRRLHDALATARRCTPTIRRGDLIEDLATVAADAPPEATLVVYHTAVLAYVDYDARQAFADKVTELGAVWLANEAPGVIALAGGGRSPTGGFELIRDGTQLLAHTDSHGAWINWHTA